TPAHHPQEVLMVRARRALVLLLCAAPIATVVAAAAPADSPLLGFAADRAAKQRELEAKLDAAIDPAQTAERVKVLSARPPHVGSRSDKENAERMAGWFKEWGYESSIEEFQVLFPTPKERHLELVAPTKFQASLAEDTIPEDSTSGQHAEQLPTYNA